MNTRMNGRGQLTVYTAFSPHRRLFATTPAADGRVMLVDRAGNVYYHGPLANLAAHIDAQVRLGEYTAR